MQIKHGTRQKGSSDLDKMFAGYSTDSYVSYIRSGADMDFALQ